MRHVELRDSAIEITLTGITMLEAFQGRLEVPYENIAEVYDHVQIPSDLVRVGGTALGLVHEGHYVGPDGWYFLSYEHPSQVISLALVNFHLGRQLYSGVAIEVDNPKDLTFLLNRRIKSSAP